MRCSILGAGAIGKAVAGYVLSKAGGEVAFLDVYEPVIVDLNLRNSYLLYDGKETPEAVENVRGYVIGTPQANNVLSQSQILVTAVGPKGFQTTVATIAQAVRKRTEKAIILFFENDPSSLQSFVDQLGGQLPENVFAFKASIERMSNVRETKGRYDVYCEPFLPVILDSKAGNVHPMFLQRNLFQLVDDVSRYYARKLFTNNLGHAVIGFWGLSFGCKNTKEALSIPEVRARVYTALKESAAMMVKEYGFSQQEMDAHINDLITRRYCFTHMDDPLERLTRDPVRKIGYDERLVGAARRCLQHGIAPTAIIETICIVFCELTKGGRYGDKQQALKTLCGLTPQDHLGQELLKKIC